jgi:hypothetical protein
VPYELVDGYTSGVTRFERDRGEPEFRDQELDQAMLHREQLMRAVGALTEPYDLGVGEELDQLLQVRCSPIWFRRGHRHSGVPPPRDHRSERCCGIDDSRRFCARRDHLLMVGPPSGPVNAELARAAQQEGPRTCCPAARPRRHELAWLWSLKHAKS